MAESEDIMSENFILLKGCSRGYDIDKNVEKLCLTHSKTVCQTDDAFLCLRKFDSTD